MTDPAPAADGAPTSTLLVAAGLADVGGVDPHHRALLVEGDRITWTGSDPAEAPPAGAVVDLGGSWLAPGFVDAHVHATATGMLASGIDLSGARSAAAVLDAVRSHAAATDERVIHGAAWDDLGWPEGRPPTAVELAGAAPGRMVVLTRVDGHSCLVDQGTLQSLPLDVASPDVVRDAEGEPTGWLLEAAAGTAQQAMLSALSPSALSRARDAACGLALDLGITAVHEMGVPGLGSREDALIWASGDWPLSVHVWWAEMAVDPQGLLRPGGDLFLDGSIGSCTAATSSPYATNDGGRAQGELFHDDEVVAAFFEAATRAGVGAGVHAIGDRAVAQAVEAIREAARRCGVDAVRAARHRIEHLELIRRDDVAVLAELGVVASVQPAFDATWNGPDGLYEHRFGRGAADDTNPFDWLAAAGVAMAFGSDSVVTPLDPWGGVIAAEHHHGGHGIDRRTALQAATIGGSHAVGVDHPVGALRPGLVADVVAWPGDPSDPTTDPRGWTPTAVLSRGIRRR